MIVGSVDLSIQVKTEARMGPKMPHNISANLPMTVLTMSPMLGIPGIMRASLQVRN